MSKKAKRYFKACCRCGEFYYSEMRGSKICQNCYKQKWRRRKSWLIKGKNKKN